MVPATAQDETKSATYPACATIRLTIETAGDADRHSKLRRSIETVERQLDALGFAYRTEQDSGPLMES